MTLREEAPGDEAAIARVVARAFEGAPHASGTEGRIVAALRAAGALTLSIVAVEGGEIVGHAAFSPVEIEGQTLWFGLGPVAVIPECQASGIGTRLIRHGLNLLTARGAAGCVVLGEPGFYGRFGFEQDPALTFPGPPAEYFQRLVLTGDAPSGVVRYHPAFVA